MLEEAAGEGMDTSTSPEVISEEIVTKDTTEDL